MNWDGRGEICTGDSSWSGISRGWLEVVPNNFIVVSVTLRWILVLHGC